MRRIWNACLDQDALHDLPGTHLTELLTQIPSDQDIRLMIPEGAYDPRKYQDAIAAPDAHAVIPPRRITKTRRPSTDGASVRNEAMRA